MDNQAAIIRQKLIEDSNAFILTCEKAKLKNTIVSHGWVVWNPVTGTGLDFAFQDLGNGRKRPVEVHNQGILRTTCFTKEDAVTLASDIKCGPDNVPAVAMFINDALELTIEIQKSCIDKIEHCFR